MGFARWGSEFWCVGTDTGTGTGTGTGIGGGGKGEGRGFRDGVGLGLVELALGFLDGRSTLCRPFLLLLA